MITKNVSLKPHSNNNKNKNVLTLEGGGEETEYKTNKHLKHFP